MAIGIKTGRFQFQRGSKADWEKADLILLDGELAFESDTSKIKIGDGRSKYADLPYITIGEVAFGSLTDEEKKLIEGPRGKPGEPFTYDMFTAEQRLDLKGDLPVIKSSTPPPLDKKDYIWIKPDNRRYELGEYQTLNEGCLLALGDIHSHYGYDVEQNPGAIFTNHRRVNTISSNHYLLKFNNHTYEVEIETVSISRTEQYNEVIFKNPDDIKDLMENVPPSFDDYDNDAVVVEYVNSLAQYDGSIREYKFEFAKIISFEDYSTINVYDEKTHKWVKVAEDGETGPRGLPGPAGKGVLDVNTGKEAKIWTGTMEEYEGLTDKEPNTLYLIRG